MNTEIANKLYDLTGDIGNVKHHIGCDPDEEWRRGELCGCQKTALIKHIGIKAFIEKNYIAKVDVEKDVDAITKMLYGYACGEHVKLKNALQDLKDKCL